MCQKCGIEQKQHPEDKRMGWKQRKAFISAVKPEGHGITMNGEFTPLSELYCDQCGQPITGTTVVAVTNWIESREGEPRCWESEYGTILPPEAVEMERKLTK